MKNYIVGFDSNRADEGLCSIAQFVPKQEIKLFPLLGLASIPMTDYELNQVSTQGGNIKFIREEKKMQAIFYPNMRSSEVPCQDSPKHTWGLHATGVLDCEYTGKGTRLCILDTGFDSKHPDFKGRKVTTESFIRGESSEDGHGHGTHCMGTAGGYKNAEGKRYGIAYEAELFAGKVLSNSGGGSDTSILGGIEWALQNNCHIISLSLGNMCEEYDPVYEQAARKCLDNDCLMICAAGNHRPGTVGQPANSPSAMAVGAVNDKLELAYFSCGSGKYPGSEVDVVAPGVDVYSSLPGGEYGSWSGTSMATPHVAGLAALYVEMGLLGVDIMSELYLSCKSVDIPVQDAGWGLAVAP